ncbi:Crp/Fnr family transcriptional regulator [Azospirillum sp. TSO22-1]|uniref:Crp/Fnr family transcriptional regulator n=1 Tax=Azospirillum sp. TSO22-1 TaxID=716789 RepID=UPI000D60F437|nr:Crp/Fnr family transcriptional regulator [Azospirillum sp. TSO22-1]PWC56521.1 Crp/Fnr family transcriptional regulator [Azospirillum sp. TSO22-1]
MSRPTDTLVGIPLFRSLDPVELTALSARCLWRRVEAGQWIIDHEDEGTDVFFVLAGQVRVTIRAVSGREVILRDIPAGEFFGEMAAIDGKARSAGIVAVTGATVARMPAPLFRECIHRHPDVCDQVLRLLTGEIRKLAGRVNESNTLDVKHRIYAELLRLARPDGRGAVVSPPPPHADLAGRVGTRREAVSRVLSALEKEGLLEKRRGALVLRDPAALEKRVRRAMEDG